MKSITFERIAGITMLVTGMGHTVTHFILQTSQHPHPKLELAMANSILKIGSEVSVLDFHNGFSLAMGTLLVGFGVSVLRSNDKTDLLIHIILSSLIVSISAFYFPIFVIVLTSITFVTLLIRLLRYDH